MKTTDNNKFRVFLCHVDADKPTVRKLCDKLTKDYIDAWLAEDKLLGGQKWKSEIPQAIRQSDIVLILLSNHSIKKEGYVQKEIKYALEIAEEKPEGMIFIIPVRLEDCEIPPSLTNLQSVDYFGADGYDRLIKSFEEKANKVGKNIRTLRQNLVFICEICDKPISIYEDEGHIFISEKELREAQRISKELEKRKGKLIPSSEFRGTIARWHKAHYACDRGIDSSYEIGIYRIRTLQKLIGWTSHLMWKKWIGNTDWPQLLREVIGNPEDYL